MKLIPLTRGKFAQVDDEDFERISTLKWFCMPHRKTFYAARNHWENGKRRTQRMHREILGLKIGDPEVDHWDGDGLNNTKQNLRKATDAQTCMNRVGWSKCGFKGVSERNVERENPWEAHIGVNGRLIHIGVFPTAKAAALAYNAKALELFGEFARLNPI